MWNDKFFLNNKLSGVLGWRDYAGSIRIVDDIPVSYNFTGSKNSLLQNWATDANAWLWEEQIMRTKKRRKYYISGLVNCSNSFWQILFTNIQMKIPVALIYNGQMGDIGSKKTVKGNHPNHEVRSGWQL